MAKGTYTSYLGKLTHPAILKISDCKDWEAYEENHPKERKGTDKRD